MTVPLRPPDRALWGILASNGLTLLVALVSGWSVLPLLWPFWIQSVVIGVYARRRIQKLQSFSTEGFQINDRAVEPNARTRSQVANFFALHYGLFHVVYVAFLLVFTVLAAANDGMVQMTNSESGEVSNVAMGQIHALDWLLFAGLGFAFWRSHAFSHSEHVQADLGGQPNIGTLMFMPYLRILPMHLTIILGAALGGGSDAVLLFMALKTLADVGMHRFEHRRLAHKARP